MNILFVCSGNTFRSVIAEALLKKQKLENVKVKSAGTNINYLANTPSKHVKALLESEGLECKRRGRALTEGKIKKADLIICMEEGHKNWILRRVPEAEHKIMVWNIGTADTRNLEEVKQRYDEIKQRVKGLIQELNERSGSD